MVAIPLGVLAIILGVKAFTPDGLPLSKHRNLTGTSAKIIGLLCILGGIVFLVSGLVSLFLA